MRKYGEKKSSYEWREKLKVGDRVLFYFDRKWSEFEIMQREENGQINISEIINGKPEEQYIDIDIYNENLEQLGSNPLSVQTFDEDDEIYLELVPERQWAIVRNQNPGANSIFIVKYINKFGEFGGFEFLFEAIDKKVAVS